MTQHHRDSLKALLVEQTLSLARTLVLTAEPVKAVKLLEEVAPQAAIDADECRAMANRIRAQADQAFSETAYLDRYTKYDNGGVPNVPFSDTGVLSLFRAQAMLEVTRRFAETKPTFRYLSVGGGDGTIPRAVLREHPGATLWFSELLGVGGAVVDALKAEFPGRVHVEGRFDTSNPTPQDYFDLVECLEVAEHVTDLAQFLTNLRAALTKDGILCVSVPNHLDWIEPKMLSDFDKDDNWYHHVRALTAKSLAKAHLEVGLLPTVFHDANRGLFAVSTAVDYAIDHAFEGTPTTDAESAKPGDVVHIGPRTYVDPRLMPGVVATVCVHEGILLESK